MDLKRKTITCTCNTLIDTTENPVIAICPACNRRWQRQASKLMLLDREEVICPGVVIS